MKCQSEYNLLGNPMGKDELVFCNYRVMYYIGVDTVHDDLQLYFAVFN